MYPMANGPGFRIRRVNAADFLSRFRGNVGGRRTNFAQYYSGARRRRFIRPYPGSSAYRYRNRFVARPLGNPLAITERKYTDTELVTSAISQVTTGSGWANTLVNPAIVATFVCPTVGTSFQQRIGRKIQLVSLRIRGEVGIYAQAVSGAAHAQTLRMIVFQDKQTNGIPLENPADLLYSGNSGAVPVHYFQNANSFGRYKILFDKYYNMQAFQFFNISESQPNIPGRSYAFNLQFNFRTPITIHFNAQNTGTIQDIIDNSFHMAIGVDNPSPGCFVNYKARGVFFDA